MKSKRGAKAGDIIELVPQRYISDEVWVESISNDQIAEKFPSGSFAILFRKRKSSAVIMTESGFIGWVYNDEWQTLSTQKGDS